MEVSNAPKVYAVGDADVSTLLSAAQPLRKGYIARNDSTSAMNVLYSNGPATVSTSNYTFRVAAYQTFTMDQPIHTGEVYGIWDSDAGGSIYITEQF